MTYSPGAADASCASCTWPVLITGDTSEKRDAAAAEWRACSSCRTAPVLTLVEDDTADWDDWRRHVEPIPLLLLVACPPAVLALLIWLIYRAT